MSKDQNISMDYAGVHFNEPLLSFMELSLRIGIPKIHQAAMMVVQDFVVKYSDPDSDHDVGYEAKRSTYGREQHLNVYEEFSIQLDGKPKYCIYSEYANDPHHRIDATNTHHDAGEVTFEGLIEFVREHQSTGHLEQVIQKLYRYSDEFTTATDEEHIYGFWFRHEHGKSMIGIDLRSLQD